MKLNRRCSTGFHLLAPEMLDGRYDDIKSGRVKPIDGEAFSLTACVSVRPGDHATSCGTLATMENNPVGVGQLSWHWAYVQNWRATPPVAAAAPGTSPTPRPYPSRFLMPISKRSGSRLWRMRASVTISNRRVRTCTHGGVAGVSGQPLPLCRSNAVTVEVKSSKNQLSGFATYN